MLPTSIYGNVEFMHQGGLFGIFSPRVLLLHMHTYQSPPATIHGDDSNLVLGMRVSNLVLEQGVQEFLAMHQCACKISFRKALFVRREKPLQSLGRLLIGHLAWSAVEKREVFLAGIAFTGKLQMSNGAGIDRPSYNIHSSWHPKCQSCVYL